MVLQNLLLFHYFVFTIFGNSVAVGASADVFGEFVPVLAPSKFPATFDIVFPPAFIPSFVTDTGFLVVSLGVIVNPFTSSLDVFPSLSVTVVPVGVVTTVFLLSSLTSTFSSPVNSFDNE